MDFFDSEYIPASLWIHKWLITTLCLDFPHGSTLRVWDMFLMNGLTSNLSFIVAFILSQSSQIIKMNLTKFALHLKTFSDGISEITNDLHRIKKHTKINP